MEYKIIDTNDADNMEKEVMRMIRDGLEPIGGVSAIKNDWEDFNGKHHDIWLYQAMIKRGIV